MWKKKDIFRKENFFRVKLQSSKINEFGQIFIIKGVYVILVTKFLKYPLYWVFWEKCFLSSRNLVKCYCMHNILYIFCLEVLWWLTPSRQDERYFLVRMNEEFLRLVGNLFRFTLPLSLPYVLEKILYCKQNFSQIRSLML